MKARSPGRTRITGFAVSPARLWGFTLLELVVVACVVAILAGSLLSRVWFYQEQAERASMEQVAAAVQSALTLEYARLMLRGQEQQASMLATQNPMNWLARKPANYAGEFNGATPQSAPPGSWMFDSKSRELIYVPDRSEYFTPGPDGAKWVRYRVSLVYEAPAPDGRSTRPVGAVLELAGSSRWFDRRP